MAPKTRRGIVLLTLLALLSWLLARQPREAALDPISKPDVKLNYALYDFRGTLLNEHGGVNLQVQSPVLRNDAESGVATVDAPEIHIQQERDRWYISAESAVISPDHEQVTLAGKVYLSQHDEITGRVLEISASDVLLNVTPRTAETATGVSIRQGGDRLDAVGMKLDMIAKRYELLHQVRAHYEMP